MDDERERYLREQFGERCIQKKRQMEMEVIWRDGGIHDLIRTEMEEQIQRVQTEGKNYERMGGKRNGGMSCVLEERDMTGNSKEFERRRTDRESNAIEMRSAFS